jgi:hypothetical protein
MRVQTGAVAAVLLFLVLSILGYLSHGIRNDTENIFNKRSFTTTWSMYLLIVGEIGGLSVILWGFIETQII